MTCPWRSAITWRVFWALKWAFSDFDSESVKMDLPYIPEAELADLVEDLHFRTMQLQLFHETLSQALGEKSKQRK
jgi:hypothetical protein